MPIADSQNSDELSGKFGESFMKTAKYNTLNICPSTFKPSPRE